MSENKEGLTKQAETVEGEPVEPKKEFKAIEPYLKRPPKFEPAVTPIPLPNEDIKKVYKEITTAFSRISAIEKTIEQARIEFEKKVQELEEKGQKVSFENEYRTKVNELAKLLTTVKGEAVDMGDEVIAIWKRIKETPFRPSDKWKVEKLLERFGNEAKEYLERATNGAQNMSKPENLESLVQYPKTMKELDSSLELSASDIDSFIKGDLTLNKRANVLDVIDSIKEQLQNLLDLFSTTKQGLTELTDEVSPALASLDKKADSSFDSDISGDPKEESLMSAVDTAINSIYSAIESTIRRASSQFQYFRFPGFKSRLMRLIRAEFDKLDGKLEDLYTELRGEYVSKLPEELKVKVESQLKEYLASLSLNKQSSNVKVDMASDEFVVKMKESEFDNYLEDLGYTVPERQDLINALWKKPKTVELKK